MYAARASVFLVRELATRYVFEFLLPLPERIFELRLERAQFVTHPVDEDLDIEQICRQVK